MLHLNMKKSLVFVNRRRLQCVRGGELLETAAGGGKQQQEEQQLQSKLEKLHEEKPEVLHALRRYQRHHPPPQFLHQGTQSKGIQLSIFFVFFAGIIVSK
jgi:hypothetical protein